MQGPVLESLGEIEKLSWVGIGFPMGSVATILLLGSLYGSFEIKWLYLGSIILFEAGSAICGAAPSMDVLIFSRIITGIGGAGMYLGWVRSLRALRPFEVVNKSQLLDLYRRLHKYQGTTSFTTRS